MKTLAAFALAMLLCSCSTQIQLEHLEPGAADLVRGSKLSIDSENVELTDTLIQQLENERFFHLTPDAKANLYLSNVKTHSYSGLMYHTCTSDAICTCVADDYVEAEAQVRVAHPGILPYVKDFSVTKDTDDSARQALAAEITKALVPHTETRTFRINPASENENLPAAAKACASGNWELGRTLATFAVKRYPTDPEGHFLMGLIERNAGNWKAAAEHMREAIRLRDDTAYKETLAETERLATDTQRALRQLNGPVPPPSNYIPAPEKETPAWQYIAIPLLLGLPLLWD